MRAVEQCDTIKGLRVWPGWMAGLCAGSVGRTLFTLSSRCFLSLTAAQPAAPCIWAELPSLASPLSNANDIPSLQLNQISRSTLWTLQDEGREIILVLGCYELTSVPQIHMKI